MNKVIAEIDKKIPVSFTESALKEIQRLANLEGEDKVLNLGVKNGGCSGFTYVFDFKELPVGSTVYDLNGVRLAIQDLDLQYLENITIDYEQGLNNRGFTFTNPNASTTCGCGTSFA